MNNTLQPLVMTFNTAEKRLNQLFGLWEREGGEMWGENIWAGATELAV